MQPLALFIAIALVFAVYSYLGFIKKPEDVSKPQETVSELNLEKETPTKTGENGLKLEQQKPAVLVDTQITSGPEDGEAINKTNRVTFEFKGTVYPLNTKGVIYFETKVVGLDKDWKSTNTKTITIDFPPGAKEYTFLVRARINNFLDSTPASRTFTVNLSLYSGKVKISSISQSQITLASYLSEGEKINMSNWKVKGTNGEIIVPQGVELYLPANPSSKENIFIKQYDAVYLFSSRSPFGEARSFRPNKCFGYLENSPFPYSKICPTINCEEIRYFSESCQNLIRQLQNCNPLNYSSFSWLSFDSSCQAYVDNYTAENLNYEGCVENYYKDKDFFQRMWYVYVGYSIFCKCNDTIYLYDGNGLLVDWYYYKS